MPLLVRHHMLQLIVRVSQPVFQHVLSLRLKLLVERRERGKSIAGVPSVDGLSAWFEEAAPSTSTSPPPTMRAYVRD